MKLQIKFDVYQLVTERIIHFNDEVEPEDVNDYMKRVGNAISMLYDVPIGNIAVRFASSAAPLSNKIQLIKTVRDITGCGLKEAKHAVECSPLTCVMVIQDGRHVGHVRQKLEEVGSPTLVFNNPTSDEIKSAERDGRICNKCQV